MVVILLTSSSLAAQEFVIIWQPAVPPITIKLVSWQLPGFDDIDGLAQDYSISSASVMKLLQSCTKPSIHIITDLIYLIK